MIIVVAGPPGSGKTTVAERLAGGQGYVLVSSGRMFRQMAEERGMDLAAFGAHAETHHEVDRELDRRVLEAVRAAGKEGRTVVVDGRIQAHLLPREGLHPFRVLITAPLDVRAKRIAGREGKTAKQAEAEILVREASERTRYRAIYGIDLDDASAFELRIDSTSVGPEAIADRILREARAWPSR